MKGSVRHDGLVEHCGLVCTGRNFSESVARAEQEGMGRQVIEYRRKKLGFS